MQKIQVNQFGGPEVMQLVEAPTLAADVNQIRIDVKATGVNPVDTYIRSGIYPMKPDLPYTPGLDAAGIVSEVGSEISHLAIGDRVYTFGSLTGCYAESILCRADQVFPLPDNVSFSEGAALGVPYSTAYYALHNRAQIKSGESLLIHGGSGAVGQAAIQIGKAAGAKVYATAGTDKGIELLQSQGVDTVYNHHQEGYLDKMFADSGSDGFDVILEMLANVNLANDLQLLAKFGRVVVIGNRGTIEIDPRLTMGKNASILGMSLFNTPTEEMTEIHEHLFTMLSEGSLKPVIHSELPLAQAGDAHDLVMQSGINGKIVLIP